MRWLTASLTVVGLVALSFPTNLFAESHSGSCWGSDYAAAQARARQSGKPVLLHFYATYCPPCKKMEAETLHTREVMDLLSEDYESVLINAPKQPDLAERFNVQKWPTDVFVSPDGRVLGTAEGYVSKQQYVSMLNSKASSFRVARQARERERRLAAKMVEQQKREAEEPIVSDHVQLALEGFCPVTLWRSRAWKNGDTNLTYEFEGEVYTFAGQEELDDFKADPTRYAPRYRGCDPVLLSETELEIVGSTKYGAYFNGELFLFKSLESRKRFKQDPSLFTSVKQAKREPKLSRN